MVDQVLHDLHLVLSFAVGLEEAGSEEQRQVLSAHLVQVGALLDPEGGQRTRIFYWAPSGRVQLGLVPPAGDLDKGPAEPSSG